MVCLGLALFLAFASAPLVRTVVRQILLMVPRPLEAGVYGAYQRELQSSPETVALARVFQELARGPASEPDLALLQRYDDSNGLYVYLQLLALLRGGGELTTTRPAEIDVKIRALLKRCPSAPPARIHIADERNLAQRVLRRGGLSPREIAVQADRMPYALRGGRGSSMPILRELADRLIEQAGVWRSVGRQRDATAADRAVVRLLTDLVADSPAPEVALLASEKLPAALRGLGAEAEALQAEMFRRRWHEIAREDRVNVLPWTGDFVLARAAHDRALRSLIASGLSVGAWLMLAVICLLLLLMVAVIRPPGDAHLVWRWNGRAAWVAPAIVCGPVIALLVVIAGTDVPFTWLVSYPSLPAAALLAAMPVSVGLATRLCVRPGEGFTQSLIPMGVVWAIGLLLAVTAVGALIFLPLATETWRPPPGIQRFRQLGFVLGAECVVVVVVWIGWGIMRRARAGLAAGIQARANLAVASAALLAVSVVSLAVLGFNQYRDVQHRRAFVEAAADPIADRLGESWRQDYFAPARAVIETPTDS